MWRYPRHERGCLSVQKGAEAAAVERRNQRRSGGHKEQCTRGFDPSGSGERSGSRGRNAAVGRQSALQMWEQVSYCTIGY